MSSITSEFLFALTNPWSEKALKMEVGVMNLKWRPGYQQRGFVTFKSESPDVPFRLNGMPESPGCARRLCLSLGKVASIEAAQALLDATSTEHPGTTIALRHSVRLDRGRVDSFSGNDADPVIGQCVATIVELAPGEFWVGLHRHGLLLSPDPGGHSPVAMPEDSPSRAYLKLEDAARFFGLTFGGKDIVVEVGCAPGGVILALLRRGVPVIGVDPARLAPVVMTAAISQLGEAEAGRPWVWHCRKPAALVAKRDLAVPATWFMSDMNQSPLVALKECARMIKMCPSIRSALITLKLTDVTQVIEKPAWVAALKAMGFPTIRLQQLSVHHKEFALLALGRKDL